MAFNVGHIEATLTGRFDDRAFKQFDKAVAQARHDAKRGINAQAGAKTETAGFKQFDREVRGAREQARRGIHAQAGAKTETAGFQRFDREVRGARTTARRAINAQTGAQVSRTGFARFQSEVGRARREARRPAEVRVGANVVSRGFVRAREEVARLRKGARDQMMRLRVNVDGAGRAEAQLRGVKREADGASTGLLGAAKGMKAGIAGIVAAVAGMTGFSVLKDSIGYMKQLGAGTRQLQAITKGDTEANSEWVAVADLRGVKAKQLAMGFSTLSKQMVAGSSSSSAAFRALGISQRDLEASGGRQLAVIGKVADGLKGIKSPAERAAVAQQLFGRSSKALLPLLSQGGAEVEKQLQKQKALGNYLDGSGGAALKKAAAAQRDYEGAMRGMQVQLARGVIPALAGFAKWFAQAWMNWRTHKGTAGDIRRTLSDIAKGATWMAHAVINAVKGVIAAVKWIDGAFDDAAKGILGAMRAVERAVRGALRWVADAFSDVGKWIAGAFRGAASGVGRAAGSVGHAIAQAFRGVIGWVKGAFRDVGKWVAGAFRGAAGGVSRAVGSVGHAIASGFRGVIGWVKGAFRDVVRWVPKALGDAAGTVGHAASRIASAVWNVLKGLPGRVARGFGNIGGAVGRMFKSGANIAIDALNMLIRAWNSLRFKVPKVDLGPLGHVGGGTIGVPRIPTIPHLAKGGPVEGHGDPKVRALFAAAGARRFADGGSVGTDTVPALLTPGEFVMSKPAVDRIGVGNLAAANKGGGGKVAAAAAAALRGLVPSAKKAGADSAVAFQKALAAGSGAAHKAGAAAALAVGKGLAGGKGAATKAGLDTRAGYQRSLGRMDDDARAATRNVTRAMDSNLAGGARLAQQRGTATRRGYTAGVYGMRSDADRHTRAVANAVRSHLGQAATAASGQGRRTRTGYATPLFGMRADADRHTRVIAERVRTNLGRAADVARAQARRLGDGFGSGMSSADRASYRGLSYILAATRKALSGMGGKMPAVTINVPPKFASGSWVGRPGERGRDTVHALLGRGEAVLTRHQQRHVERALRISRRLGGPIGSLRELFSRERTPHSHARVEGPLRRRLRRFAGGGLVGASDFGGHDDPSAYHHSTKSGLIMDDSTWGYAELSHPGTLDFAALGNLPMGTILAITYGGQTVRAPKIDVGRGGGSVGGHPRAIDLTYAVAQRLARGRWPGLAVVRISGPQGVNLHLGANSGAAAPKLKRPKVGGSGPVRELVALALDKVGDAAQSKLNRTAAAMSPPSGGTGWSGGPLPRGLGTFDGRPVAAWIVPQLRYARAHGWTGPITSGYRTPEQNRAAGGAPNSQHMRPGPYPFGAVDFGGGYGYWDPVAAANRHAFFVALRGYTGPKLIPANGPDRHMGGAFLDWGHASGTGGETGGWLNGEPFAVGGVVGESLLTDDGELIGYPDTNLPGGLLGALAERAQPFSGGGMTGRLAGGTAVAPSEPVSSAGLSSGTFFPYINADTASARWHQLYRIEQRGSQHVHVYPSGATVVATPGRHRDALSGYSYTTPAGGYVSIPSTSPLAKYPPPAGVYVHQGPYSYQTPTASGAPIGVGRPPAPQMGWRGAYYIQRTGTGFAVTAVRDTSPLAPYGPPKGAIGAWYMDGKGNPAKWVPAESGYFPWLTRPYGTQAPTRAAPSTPSVDPNAPSEDNEAEAYLTQWERGFLHLGIKQYLSAVMNTPYDPMKPDPKAYLDDMAAARGIAGVWKNAFSRMIADPSIPFSQISAVGQAYRDAWDTYYISAAQDYKSALEDAANAINTGSGGGGGDTGSSGGGGGGDSGSGGGTTAPSAADIAAAAYQQLQTFNQARQDLFATYGGNLVTGPVQGDPTTYAAGRRYWGAVPQMATGGIAGSGGPTTVNITQHFASGPPEPHNHAQSLAWEVRTAV